MLSTHLPRRGRAVLQGVASFASLALALSFSTIAHAQSIDSVSLTPASVTGGSGASATATIRLNAPAPSGGLRVAVSSSNPALTAVNASVTVPAGASSATVVVGTNAKYRRYSGLAFSARITASVNSTSGSATLSVTAQARPANINSDSSQRSGLVCGGAYPMTRGEAGILYSCATGVNLATPGVCSFRQECLQGCQTRQPNGFSYSDACTTTVPYPVALAAAIVDGGSAVAGSTRSPVASQAAPLTVEATVTSNNPVAAISPLGPVALPIGATSLPFTVNSSAVAAPSFAQISASVRVPQSLSGGGVFRSFRLAHAWLAVLPTDGVAPLTVASLGLQPASVVGGNAVTATVTLTQPAPAAGTMVQLSNSRPDVASVPVAVAVPAGTNAAAFTVSTVVVGSATPVTLGATVAGVTQSATLNVNPAASTGPLSAPSLAAPAANSRLPEGAAVSFDWSDVTGASTYALEVDNSSTIAAPLSASASSALSQFQLALPAGKYWWRVRAISSTGSAGAWSSVRQFEVK